MIRVSQLKLSPGHSLEELYEKTAKLLHIKREQIVRLEIRRQSVDARKKPDIRLIYVLDVKVSGISEQKCVQRCKSRDVSVVTEKRYVFPQPGERRLEHRPVIIGTGPAGLFCGYLLAVHGYFWNGDRQWSSAAGMLRRSGTEGVWTRNPTFPLEKAERARSRTENSIRSSRIRTGEEEKRFRYL